MTLFKTNQTIKKYLTAVLLLSPFQAFSESQSEFNITLLHDSIYISEGRNNLEDGGLNSIELSTAWNNVSAGLWYAEGSDTSYNELNLFVEYGFNIGNVEAYAGLTRLEFPNDDEHDNEISAGIATPVLSTSEFAIDYVYSTEAKGGFLDLTFVMEIPLGNEHVTLTPYITQSFDFGYASDDFDGENNFQFGIEGSWTLTETFSLVGLIAQSWAQKDVRLDDSGDQNWISIGISKDI